MKIDGNLPISKLAAELPGAISVFESLGIDYSCAGDRSLNDAAHAEGIAPEVVISTLRRMRGVDRPEAWGDRPLVELTRHLVAQHHRFVREELAAIAVPLADACTSSAEPDLLSLRAAFTRLTDIVLPHLHREEENIFPAIEVLESAWQSTESLVVTRGEVSALIRQLALEHGVIAAQLRTMRELRMNLAESSSLPNGCRAILDHIETLEAHLHEYMFLENCVLFPRALALETQLVEPAKEERDLVAAAQV